MRRTRPLPALVAAGPVLALLLASPPTSGAAAAGPAYRPLSTPILSARRDPSWIDDTVADQRLSGTLDAATAGLKAAKGVTACVVADSSGRQLYSLNPTTELLPASNMKLVTATAVLDSLGPNTRSTTAVRASAAPRGGKVTGNLYLVGGGDPYLFTAAYDNGVYYPEPTYTSLNRLAAAVRAAGVTTVTGSVVGDGSRYDSQIGVAGWDPQYLAEQDVGPLSALEVDDGALPPADPTKSSAPATAAPAGPPNPTLYAARTFTALLEADGVKVTGPAATGRTPDRAVTVTQQESAPLGAAVDQMLNVSDDTAAELFTKEMGYRGSGQGTTSAGTAVIRRDIAADGLPVGQLVAADGSGLDRQDRATCSLITDVLERAGTNGVLAAGLPVAARTGTLQDRMAGTAAAGRLHAKTGTLSGVSALSGFVPPAGGAPTRDLGGPVYFSIIINGMNSGNAALLADRIGAAIATYPQAVPLRLLGPQT